MSRPVSIVVWCDVKTDPPRLGTDSAVLAQYKGGDVVATFSEFVAEHPAHFKAWAELPVVSDLTDKDIRRVRHCANRGLDTWPDIEAYDRFCAALGGEKEETW